MTWVLVACVYWSSMGVCGDSLAIHSFSRESDCLEAAEGFTTRNPRYVAARCDGFQVLKGLAL